MDRVLFIWAQLMRKRRQMSAATAIALPPSPATSSPPPCPSRAIKLAPRPIPEAIARVLTAELKAQERAFIQLLRHGPVCLCLKTTVSENGTPITSRVTITPIASREHRQSRRAL